ncbi:OsmC family peroxiredoxin [Isoptericola sp. BMS4]|uniref:OsmC family peroxiredoxin n=1 Tax=Isoptericola sp. BMS4 TaxID=2527875 RepID=UPI001421A239|nr:OsmC family peroxiredoxin [Isoptericola sp. BMS4]
MPTRTARTAWNGSLEEGSGQVQLASSGAGTFDVSFPKRAAEDADGTTSPEELIAAAHSSCFAMAFSLEVANAGGTPGKTDVSADVTLSPAAGGGFEISKVLLSVVGSATGIDADAYRAAAEAAKAGCPVSKALGGVGQIVLDVKFEG